MLDKEKASEKNTGATKDMKIYTGVVGFFAWTFAVYDYVTFGDVLPYMGKSFGWTADYETFLATIVGVGVLIVSLLVGPMIDYFGRRKSLMITSIGAALSSGFSSLTFSAVYLVIVRAFSGLGYSEQAVNSTFMSEILGKKTRGSLYSFVQGGWPVGVLLASLALVLLLPVVGWRGVYLVATFPALVIGLSALRLKESERFQHVQEIRKLKKQGKNTEAEAYGKEYRIDYSEAEKGTYMQLFDKKERKNTVFLAGSFMFSWIAIEIFIVFSTILLITYKGLPLSSSVLILIVSNGITYLGYVMFGFLGDRISRRNVIAFAWIISAIMYTVFAFFSSGFAASMVTYSLGLLFLIGPYSALFTYMGETYPTRNRGTGIAFINAMGPVGSIIGGALFTVVLAVTASYPDSMLIGAIALVIAGVLMFGARNVRPGQELEDIAT